jgi:putative exosortase-associated protein (TIGR04073 family)
MKFFKKCLVLLFILSSVCFAPQCFAQDEQDAVYGNQSGPFEKLGRGVANLVFSPLELIIQPLDVAQVKGNIAALTYGVFRGVAMVVARLGVGVTDILTFYMPLPGCTDDPADVGWGYGPMLRPAWIIDREHNAFNFFYDDNAMNEKF